MSKFNRTQASSILDKGHDESPDAAKAWSLPQIDPMKLDRVLPWHGGIPRAGWHDGISLYLNKRFSFNQWIDRAHVDTRGNFANP